MNDVSQKFKESAADCFDIKVFNNILRNAINLPNNPKPDKKGGYLAVYDKMAETLVCIPFGYIPDSKKAQYLRNATEKVTRLVKNGETRSIASRNETLEHWGGGIHDGVLTIAFSGFTEEIDEAVSLVYAVYRRNIMLNGYAKSLKQDFHVNIVHEITLIIENDYLDNEFILPLARAVFA